MSLVAYDNSDCSEESDADDDISNVAVVRTSQTVEPKPSAQSPTITERPDLSNVDDRMSPVTDLPISDDEDEGYGAVSNDATKTSGLQLPAPRHSEGNKARIMADVDESQESSLVLGLPPPKAHGLLQSTSNFSSTKNTLDEEDPLEDLVKPKAAEIASREKPPAAKKKKLIRITAPIIAESDSDSDDESSSKKPRISKTGESGGRSGLFALLPAPKHATKKETGRVLLPYTLKQKAKEADSKADLVQKAKLQQAKKSQITKTSAPIVSSVSGDISSDEEEAPGASTDFFSFQSPSERSLLSAASYSATSSLSTLPAVPRSSQVPRAQPSGIYGHDTQDKDSMDVLEDPHASSTSYDGTDSQEATEDAGTEWPPADEKDDMADLSEANQEFVRLQGRRERGKEINFIDIAIDHTADPRELTKNITEETQGQCYSRKNKDQPSSQQKRKHQITYLAHRAKEREFDLKNQWAQNRSTKKQTQSRYGF